MTDKETTTPETTPKKNGLISIGDRTPEEKKAICTAGALATQKVRQQKRTMKEALNTILNDKELAIKLANCNGNATLIEAAKSGCTVNELLMLAATLQGLEGNTRSLEFVRDTSGQRPKDQIDIQADVVTAADRALIEKLRKNLVQNDDKNETPKTD